MVLFEMSGIMLSLYPVGELAKDVGIEHSGGAFLGITIAHNVRSEREVDEVLGEVERLGAGIVKRPEKVFWGGYSGYFADPDGYLFEVAYNPFWELRP